MAEKKKKTKEKDANASGSPSSMRDKAEEDLTRTPKISPELSGQTPEELIHELRVHQIELETQAEEIRMAHLALEESRDKYLDLYEFAPVGYLTLTDKALIAEINLTGATLIGLPRSKLKQARFRKFIAPHDLDVWDHYFLSVLQHEQTLPVTLLLKRGDDTVFPVRLESIRLTGKSDGETTVRVAISDITDIRQAEEALRKERDFSNNIVGTANAIILVLDTGGHIVYFNHYLEEISGYILEEVKGKDWCETFLPSHTRETTRSLFRKAIGGIKTRGNVNAIITKDGHERLIEWYDTTLKGTDGNIEGLLTIGQDVTDKKKAEDALRESDDKFRSLFEHMAAGSCVDEVIYKGGKAVDYRVLDVNSAYEEILGISKSQAIGALASQIYGTGEAPFLEVYSKVAETGEPVTFEAWFEPCRKHLQITVSCPAKGRFATVFTDITERKQEEGEIKRSFERFKTVMDGLDALVYVVDMKTYDLLFLNKYGKDIWGEIEGQTCWRTIQSGQSGPCPFCTNDRIVDSNGNPRGVYHWEFQNTVTRKWYECRDSAIRWLDGRLVRLEIATDITDRKHAADMLVITTRKLTLMNEVTYQYIQNKVTALRGYAELSKDVKTKDERLSFIEKEEHILADIQQLIKNSKEYQAMGLIQPQWISVEQSIRIAVSLVSPNPDISIEIAVPGLELYTDPLIEKIFANLIENAVIHGKTTRRIRFSCEEKPDGLILICEDDGVGISSEIKAHIFDRGFSGNARFGLFFISECIALFGMNIAETGELDKGARFEITVPKGMRRIAGRGA